MRSRLRAEAYEHQYGAERKRRSKVRQDINDKTNFELPNNRSRKMSGSQQCEVLPVERQSVLQGDRETEFPVKGHARPVLNTSSTVTNTATTTTSAMIDRSDTAYPNSYSYQQVTETQ